MNGENIHRPRQLRSVHEWIVQNYAVQYFLDIDMNGGYILIQTKTDYI